MEIDQGRIVIHREIKSIFYSNHSIMLKFTL